MFDRDATYIRTQPKARFDGAYWSSKTWVRVDPKRLFDDSAKTMPALASAVGGADPRRYVIAPRRVESKDPAAIPMPAFERIKDLNPGSTRSQLSVSAPPVSGAGVVR